MTTKHAKTIQLEREMCALSVDNGILQPLLRYRSKLLSIKVFRKILSCLPTVNTNSCDDYIFGGPRYLANTLGILIKNTPSSNSIDPPMTLDFSSVNNENKCCIYKPKNAAHRHMSVKEFCNRQKNLDCGKSLDKTLKPSHTENIDANPLKPLCPLDLNSNMAREGRWPYESKNSIHVSISMIILISLPFLLYTCILSS